MFLQTVFHWLLTSRKRTRCIIIFIFILGCTPFLLPSIFGPSDNQGIDLEHYPLHHRKVHHRATRPMSNATSNFAMMEMRFKQRKKHLEQQCQVPQYHSPNSEREVKQHLVIDKRHKLVYCAIEKIGSTFWKRVFQILNRYKNVSNPFDIQGFRAYEGYLTAVGMPFDTIYMLLRNYTKFMFVREPFERLLSGYVDKLFAPNAAYWKALGKFVVRKFRTNPSNLSLECGHDVTFKEFVRYVVHSAITNEEREPHFYPIFEHCRPCEIDYDYIDKLETFEDDTFFLMHKLKIADKVKFDDFKSEAEVDAILDAVDYVYQMKAHIGKCMSFSEALFRCFRKLQIRGILSKDVLYPFPVDVDRVINISEFKKAMLDLHTISGPSEERSNNKGEAFMEVYSSLPLDLMENITKAVFVDTSLFGYGRSPFITRNIEKVIDTSFRYFSLPAFLTVKYEKHYKN